MFPIIVSAVQISDGRIHQFFRRHIVQACQIYCIELAPARRAADAERADTAVLAKQVLVRLGQKLIFGELRFARQQSKRGRLHDGRPKSDLRADGAIAPDGALAQVDVRFEPDDAAMTAAMICLHLCSS